MADRYVIRSSPAKGPQNAKGAGMAAKIAAIKAKDAARARRRVVDRELHTTFMQVSAHLPKQPSRAWYAMRSREQKWWGSLLSHISDAILTWDDPPPLESIVTVPEVIEQFIYDCWDERIERERGHRGGAA